MNVKERKKQKRQNGKKEMFGGQPRIERGTSSTVLREAQMKRDTTTLQTPTCC